VRRVVKVPPEGCSFSYKCEKCARRKSGEAGQLGSTRILRCINCGTALHTCLPVEAQRKPQGPVWVKRFTGGAGNEADCACD
jgi:hypothetical protein